MERMMVGVEMMMIVVMMIRVVKIKGSYTDDDVEDSHDEEVR